MQALAGYRRPGGTTRYAPLKNGVVFTVASRADSSISLIWTNGTTTKFIANTINYADVFGFVAIRIMLLILD